MAAPVIRNIFLSAVSREFKRARESLKRDLSGPDLPCKIIEQADFTTHATPLLDKLDEYIAESAAVIHLVGDATGVVVDPEVVRQYLAKRPDFLSGKPEHRRLLGDFQGLSYTQWEAYMALHHDVPLYVFIAADNYVDRGLEYEHVEQEALSQKQHLSRVLRFGHDRGRFAGTDELSIMLLRSLSRMLIAFGAAADLALAVELEAFALSREQEAVEDGEGRSALTPLNVDMLMPAHLVMGHSVAAEFMLTEPGRTTLENVCLRLEVGESGVTGRKEVLGRAQTVRVLPAEQLVLQHSGTLPITVTLTLERSCLWEKFEWHDVAKVVTVEDLLRSGTFSRSAPRPRRLRFELVAEVLSPRRGVLGMELQPVPAGGCRFEMGSPLTERGRQQDELQHPVRFVRSWWMARHPVSQSQFQELMGFNPSKFSRQSERLPVENVTWQEARLFCDRLTDLERMQDKLPLGFVYRLPTEAEWEFSCRAGDDSAVATSSSKSGSDEASVISHAISTFPLDGTRGANRFGLCDMMGNVFHWCLDQHAPYPLDLQVDPIVHSGRGGRVIRGGSWHDPKSLRRPAARMHCDPDKRSSRIGFRVVLARV